MHENACMCRKSRAGRYGGALEAPPFRPGADGAVGAALAAATFGLKMSVCNYVGVYDIVLM